MMLKNARFIVFELLSYTAAHALVYYYLLQTLGAEMLGLWALLMSIGAVARFGEGGFAASCLRYVAKFKGQGDMQAVSQTIQTAFISVSVVVSITLAVAYPFIYYGLPKIISVELVGLARSLIPLMMLQLWLVMVGGVFEASLEGVNKIYLRSIGRVVSLVAYVGGVVLVAKNYGLYGVISAQILQAAFVVCFARFWVQYQVPKLPFFCMKFSFNIFRQIFDYSWKMQVILLTSLLFEPITKGMLSHFGGLSFVGYYEMANRLVLQYRNLITSVQKVIVPVVASKDSNIVEIRALYKKVYGIVFALSSVGAAGLFVVIPLIGYLWIGETNQFFIFSAALMVVGWTFSVISTPAYLILVGIGELKIPISAHVLLVVVNTVFGMILGAVLGAQGVVLATSTAFVIFCIYVIKMFKVKYEMRESFCGISGPILLIYSSLLCGILYLSLQVFFVGWLTQNIMLWLALTASVCALVGAATLRNDFFQKIINHALNRGDETGKNSRPAKLSRP